MAVSTWNTVGTPGTPPSPARSPGPELLGTVDVDAGLAAVADGG
jgi:hypothetical protein